MRPNRAFINFTKTTRVLALKYKYIQFFALVALDSQSYLQDKLIEFANCASLELKKLPLGGAVG